MKNDEKLVAITERMNHRAYGSPSSQGHPGIGFFKPGNILILGEQASDPINDPEQMPFFSTKACSGWLNWQLEQGCIPEEKMFWLNVLNNDGSPADICGTIDRMKPSEVIALGKIASNACTKLGLKHYYYPHPQYWKRFRSKEDYPLISHLRGI